MLNNPDSKSIDINVKVQDSDDSFYYNEVEFSVPLIDLSVR